MTSKSYEIMIKLLGTFPLIITRRRASIIFSGDFKKENRTNNWFWFLRFELYFGCFYLFTSNILRRIYVKKTCTCESLAVSSVYLIHVVWIDGFCNCEKFLLFNEPSLGAMLRYIKAVIVSLFAGLCDRLSGLIFTSWWNQLSYVSAKGFPMYRVEAHFRFEYFVYIWLYFLGFFLKLG